MWYDWLRPVVEECRFVWKLLPGPFPQQWLHHWRFFGQIIQPYVQGTPIRKNIGLGTHNQRCRTLERLLRYFPDWWWDRRRNQRALSKSSYWRRSFWRKSWCWCSPCAEIPKHEGDRVQPTAKHQSHTPSLRNTYISTKLITYWNWIDRKYDYSMLNSLKSAWTSLQSWNMRRIKMMVSRYSSRALDSLNSTSFNRGAGQPAFPMKVISRTWLRNKTGNGHGIPAAWSLDKFLISFSAHVFTIFLGLCLQYPWRNLNLISIYFLIISKASKSVEFYLNSPVTYLSRSLKTKIDVL